MEARPSIPPSPPGGPPVVDHREMPPGVLPRHLQQWVLVGIAIVMIGILAMGGGAPKPRATTTTASPGAAALDPNQQRIQEYQRRIQEQAQRLTHEQAELTRAKQAVAGASEADAGSPTGDRERRPGGVTSASSTSTTASLQQERAQREYQSLFADNVAFSQEQTARARSERRALSAPSAMQAPAAASAPVAAGVGERSSVAPLWVPAAPIPGGVGAAVPVPSTLAAITEPGTRPAALSSPSALGSAPTRAGDESAGGGRDHRLDPPPRRVADSTPSADRTFRLMEGTIIETVLTNRLDGTFAGPVNCLVTTPVYASDQQHLLIPAGSRVLGEAKPVNTFGQSRLAVVFHRLLLPNETRIDLHDFHGLNQVGDIGLHDQVDRHYAQIFGASLAVGAIAGLAQARTTVGLDATAIDVYREGASANVAQSSARILDRFLNLLPTVTIREGHRIKVYLSNDLELPAYREALPTAGGRP
jgi:type IV secretory pathway VirB10-like protein